MRYSRVILLGEPKSGNTTIHNSMKHMGYNFIQHREDIETKHLINNDANDVLNVPENTGVALGTIGHKVLWKKYVKLYPDALYVLNTRNEKDYLKSLFKHAWFGHTRGDKTPFYPPTVVAGCNRLVARRHYHRTIESNCDNINYIKINISEPGWLENFVTSVDSNVDVNKLLDKGFTYPGFQLIKQQKNSNIIQLHSNARPDNVLPKDIIIEINKVVDRCMCAVELQESLNEAVKEVQRIHPQFYKIRTAFDNAKQVVEKLQAELDKHFQQDT